MQGSVIALTFDDGYLDNYQEAKPILDKYGVEATFFVPVQPIDSGKVYWWDHLYDVFRRNFEDFTLWLEKFQIGSEVLEMQGKGNAVDLCARNLVRRLNSMTLEQRENILQAMNSEFGAYTGKRLLMSWQEIRRLEKDGFEIGSHTVSHVPLTDLSIPRAEQEISKSKYLLAEKVSSGVQGFCYPRGQFNPELADLVRNAGYDYAVTTRFGANGPRVDPFCLQRRNISDYKGIRSMFPVTMHMLEISGRLDSVLASRRN
ncbi:MAG: polysaccharide deacetylase family protein [Desulfurivibrionaceae bacterium]